MEKGVSNALKSPQIVLMLEDSSQLFGFRLHMENASAALHISKLAAGLHCITVNWMLRWIGQLALARQAPEPHRPNVSVEGSQWEN